MEQPFCTRIQKIILHLLLAVPMAGIAQSKVEIGAVADELAEIAAFVQARSVFESDREIVVPKGGSLTLKNRIFWADRLVLERGARISLNRESMPSDAYIVVRELVIPKYGENAVITWNEPAKPEAPGGLGRADNGDGGKGAGQNGKTGQNGKNGINGANGVHTPVLTIVLMSLEGKLLEVDLAGGIGADGGSGQAGGHGGNGAKGSSARTAWLKLLGAKTAVGCAAGPGTGGKGGNGGNGGLGGNGGAAGNGGVLRLISMPEIASEFFASVEIGYSPGIVGEGGNGGEGGKGGLGGPEGNLSTHCNSARRQGAPGVQGKDGGVGSEGAAGSSGRVENIDLSADQITRAFGLSEDL